MTIKIIRHFAEGMRTCANLDAADISSAIGPGLRGGCLLRARGLGIDLDFGRASEGSRAGRSTVTCTARS
jgi:hypothetical protein